MLIGIVGSRCSGKSSVAEILKKQGFTVHSITGMLREKAAERKLEVKHASLFSIANEYREKFGPAVLMEEALNRASATEGDCVIESIRNESEITMFMTRENAFLIGVTAEYDVRYKRACDRQKEGKQEWTATADQFKQHDTSDDADDPTRPNIHELIKQADVVIDNSGLIKDTEKTVLVALKKFRSTSRPSSGLSSPE